MSHALLDAYDRADEDIVAAALGPAFVLFDERRQHVDFACEPPFERGTLGDRRMQDLHGGAHVVTLAHLEDDPPRARLNRSAPSYYDDSRIKEPP